MKVTRLCFMCALAVLLALQGAFVVFAYALPCDCPSCQFTAFKSTQEDIYNITLEIADEYDIDEYILFALMYRESRYNQDEKNYNSNGSTDSGICQINSINWKWLADDGIDVHTTQGNIEAAACMLSMFMEDYTEREAIAAYGAGLTGMLNGRGFDNADYLYEIIDELKNI